jgi:DNA-binding MarR family transcriptional regulator
MTQSTTKLDASRLTAWRSLSSAQAVLSHQLEEGLAAEELPPAGWFDVLAALESSDGGGLRPRDLGCHVVLTKSGLTRLLDRIVEAGLIERRACERDRRGHYVQLTEAGRETLARMQPVYDRALAESFGTELSADEVERLAGLLDRALPPPPAEDD